jgi:hypothetical protein
MKLTRRELVPSLALGAAALAQGQPATAVDFATAAHDNIQRNLDALAKFAVPMSVEPAFQFKA